MHDSIGDEVKGFAMGLRRCNYPGARKNQAENSLSYLNKITQL
jgi:hypothetical protein